MTAVYGATGYTGRLVAAELLRRALDGATAVINCAGPFTLYGAPVIEAAIDVGAHLCDTTGEQPYMQRVFEFLDGPAEAAKVSVYPGGEVVTAPRHVDVRTVRQRITASTFAPSARVAGAVPALTGLLGPLLTKPMRSALDALIDRLPEGPSEDARRQSASVIVAEARGTDGVTGRCVVRGSDVYGLTAVMGVEIARRMTEGGFAKRGARAPAQAVDPEGFLRFLGDHGVTYEADPAPKPPRARPKRAGAKT